ncbi:uncharacterized protein MYCFIDRAFT_177505 [Pseudocercospora fijiensis CIRAD86]|uniref:Peptidase S33 tripeptidyl aminopeptidase-like C-terminal domain-containing protein n=1 Tax=Pseudocercospora fijiensis (strain CIRAD86) TaxID=383855 RepID=M2YS45_PSEFD|nr:uncharacterized protein MYCFIDRAFT_177505 [Pseudocercospora fijiensis CIRAD86]EME80565.1 hypothetical protein MYCFIDRAFT_177505 [Pseudocercospora fijiensis CIRAD86]
MKCCVLRQFSTAAELQNFSMAPTVMHSRLKVRFLHAYRVNWTLTTLTHASFDDSNDTTLTKATPTATTTATATATATTAATTTEMERERLTIATDGSSWSGDAAGCAYAFQWYDGHGTLEIVGAMRALAPLARAEFAELAGLELAFEHLLDDLEISNVRREVNHIDIVSDCLNAVNKILAVRSGASGYEGTRRVEAEYGIAVSFRWMRRNTLPEQQEADEWANEGSSLSPSRRPDHHASQTFVIGYRYQTDDTSPTEVCSSPGACQATSARQAFAKARGLKGRLQPPRGGPWAPLRRWLTGAVRDLVRSMAVKLQDFLTVTMWFAAHQVAEQINSTDKRPSRKSTPPTSVVRANRRQISYTRWLPRWRATSLRVLLLVKDSVVFHQPPLSISTLQAIDQQSAMIQNPISRGECSHKVQFLLAIHLIDWSQSTVQLLQEANLSQLNENTALHIPTSCSETQDCELTRAVLTITLQTSSRRVYDPGFDMHRLSAGSIDGNFTKIRRQFRPRLLLLVLLLRRKPIQRGLWPRQEKNANRLPEMPQDFYATTGMDGIDYRTGKPTPPKSVNKRCATDQTAIQQSMVTSQNNNSVMSHSLDINAPRSRPLIQISVIADRSRSVVPYDSEATYYLSRSVWIPLRSQQSSKEPGNYLAAYVASSTNEAVVVHRDFFSLASSPISKTPPGDNQLSMIRRLASKTCTRGESRLSRRHDRCFYLETDLGLSQELWNSFDPQSLAQPYSAPITSTKFGRIRGPRVSLHSSSSQMGRWTMKKWADKMLLRCADAREDVPARLATSWWKDMVSRYPFARIKTSKSESSPQYPTEDNTNLQSLNFTPPKLQTLIHPSHTMRIPLLLAAIAAYIATHTSAQAGPRRRWEEDTRPAQPLDEAKLRRSTSSSNFTWSACPGIPTGMELLTLKCANLTVPVSDDDKKIVPRHHDDMLIPMMKVTPGIPKRTIFYSPGGLGMDWVSDQFNKTDYQRLVGLFGRRTEIIVVGRRGANWMTCLPENTHLRLDETPGKKMFADENVEKALQNMWKKGEDYTSGCGDFHRKKYSLPYLGTKWAAKDLDLAREKLGFEKISFFGESMGGTILGIEYARMYPDRVERMALDGVAPYSWYSQDHEPEEIAAAAGFWDKLWAACHNAGPKKCGFYCDDIEDIRKAFFSIGPRLQRERYLLEIHGYDNEEHVGPISAVFDEQMWLQYVLKSLGVKVARKSVMNVASAIYQNAWRGLASDPDQDPPKWNPPEAAYFLAAIDQGGLQNKPTTEEIRHRFFPEFMDIFELGPDWSTFLHAAAMNFTSIDPPHEYDVNVRAPPILFIGNTGDTRTPLCNARNWQEREFPNGRLLTIDGIGHGLQGADLEGKCAKKYVRKYFWTGVLPPEGTVCEGVQGGGVFLPRWVLGIIVVVNYDKFRHDLDFLRGFHTIAAVLQIIGYKEVFSIPCTRKMMTRKRNVVGTETRPLPQSNCHYLLSFIRYIQPDTNQSHCSCSLHYQISCSITPTSQLSFSSRFINNSLLPTCYPSSTDDRNLLQALLPAHYHPSILVFWIYDGGFFDNVQPRAAVAWQVECLPRSVEARVRGRHLAGFLVRFCVVSFGHQASVSSLPVKVLCQVFLDIEILTAIVGHVSKACDDVARVFLLECDLGKSLRPGLVVMATPAVTTSPLEPVLRLADRRREITGGCRGLTFLSGSVATPYFSTFALFSRPALFPDGVRLYPAMPPRLCEAALIVDQQGRPSSYSRFRFLPHRKWGWRDGAKGSKASPTSGREACKGPQPSGRVNAKLSYALQRTRLNLCTVILRRPVSLLRVRCAEAMDLIDWARCRKRFRAANHTPSSRYNDTESIQELIGKDKLTSHAKKSMWPTIILTKTCATLTHFLNTIHAQLQLGNNTHANAKEHRDASSKPALEIRGFSLTMASSWLVRATRP